MLADMFESFDAGKKFPERQEGPKSMGLCLISMEDTEFVRPFWVTSGLISFTAEFYQTLKVEEVSVLYTVIGIWGAKFPSLWGHCYCDYSEQTQVSER